MLNNWLPLIILIVAFSTGILMLVIKEKSETLRTSVNLISAAINIVLIGIMLLGVYQGQVFETRLPLLPDINLVLKADTLSLMFVTLSGVLWFFTTIYAVGYFKHGKHRSRFFGFFSLCVFSTLGVALAGNLITFLIFYELLTLATYPLIVHKGNSASLQSGKIYLRYTMIGGAILMVGVVWLKSIAGALDFSIPDVLIKMPQLDPTILTVIFGMLMIGLGVKAAIFPIHGWLPRAMAAPAPVSSLLHAVAVVKAGAFGIIRVVHDVYGIELASSLGVLQVLLVFAGITVIYGSLRAVYQDDIKKRLAYSTVSQVSYITLGIALAGPIAAVGAVVHLVHQGLMKITMFFCAGLLAETHHIYKVSELDGIAKKMPITMTAFTIAILGMIGIPPIAGFVSKWHLGVGALESGNAWVIAVLAGSSVLNAIYFLPLVYRAWFVEAKENTDIHSHTETVSAPHNEGATLMPRKLEANWMMLMPPVVTICIAILAGLFANSQYSALSWAQLIVSSEFVGFNPFTPIISIVASQMQVSNLLIWCILIPLILSVLLVARPSSNRLKYLMPLCAIPAIYLGLQPTNLIQSIPFLFFGSELVLDDLSQGFLLLAGALWLLGSSYALFYPHLGNNQSHFMALFCVAMASSFGLVLSADMFGFITFFTFMSLSSYVLIIRGQTAAAINAANVYIKWVILGEVALFSAFCILNFMKISEQAVDDSLVQILGIMLIIGFGIKIGLLGFHSWLPLAHPVAVVPASALLSGFMVKAGMIGWLKFFPFSNTATFYHLGMVTISLGIIGAFYAALKGIGQKDPKAVLAYSTVSQMGILSASFGVILAHPELKDAMTIAIIFYCIHHGLAKSALFLSVGLSTFLNKQSTPSSGLRFLAYTLMIFPALSLIGAPFTSGFFAKNQVKALLENLPYLTFGITISAIFTGLLMCKFVHMMYFKAHHTNTHTISAEHNGEKHAELILLGICTLNVALVITAPLYLLSNIFTVSDMLFSFSFSKLLMPIMFIFSAIGLYLLMNKYRALENTFLIQKAFFPNLHGRKRPWHNLQKITAFSAHAFKRIPLAVIIANLERKLLPKETMPQNMQSSYISLLLIGVCVMFLIVFTF